MLTSALGLIKIDLSGSWIIQHKENKFKKQKERLQFLASLLIWKPLGRQQEVDGGNINI